MSNKRHAVNLTEEERMHLLKLPRKGKAPARQIARIHILSLEDRGDSHELIASTLRVGPNGASDSTPARH